MSEYTTLSDMTPHSETRTDDPVSASSSDNSRLLGFIAAGLALLMVLLIAVIFWRMIAIGRDAAVTYSGKQTTQSETSAESSQNEQIEEKEQVPDTEAQSEETPAMTLAQGRERMAGLTDSSSCQGEADAAFFAEFARLSEEAGQWDNDKGEVNARLSELPDKCGETYAVNLANRLRSASTPAGLAELVKTTLAGAGADRRPAPENAISMSNFSAPSRNIQCAFTDNRLSCTITQYDYVSEACQGAPTTYSIASDGTSNQSCGTPVSSDNVVSYGTTVAQNGLACTVNEQGVECWHEASGDGFRLSRTSVSTF